jgi:3D (Asp-Asp-Asp) domain-containing protein
VRLRPDPIAVLVVAAFFAALLVFGSCDDRTGSVDRVHVATSTTTSSTSSSTTTSTSIESSTTSAVRSPSTTNAAPSIGGLRYLGEFRVTCYGPPVHPAGAVTKSGAPVGPGSMAVDPSVVPLGTFLEVEGVGRGRAEDIGGAVRGQHVDVWVSSPSPCRLPARARVWAVL